MNKGCGLNEFKKNKTYKILLISPSFESKGGVSDFCRMLVNHLNPGFQVRQLNVGNFPGNNNILKRTCAPVQTIFKLFGNLLKSGLDVIHINPSFKILSLIRDSFYLIIIKSFRLGKKTLVFFHGWDDHLSEKLINNFLYRTIFRFIYGNVRFIFVLSKANKKQLEKLGIEPKNILVTTTMYEQMDTKIKYSREGNGRVYILFMSRFLREKGIFIAADVGRLLLENGYKNFKLIFAGDGPENENIKRYISKYKLRDYSETPGFVTGDEKQMILDRSDIFLFPTYYGEGCPVVVLEAMGRGLAIVSTPIGAIPELVKNNENGFIIRDLEPISFYEAVKRLVDDQELLRTFQENNRKKAQEKYEAKIVAKKIEAIYSTIVNG